MLVGEGPPYGAVVIGTVRYDKIFHAFATGVASWAAYEAVRRWGITATAPAVFAAVMVAAGAGAFVEIIEYVDRLLFEDTSCCSRTRAAVRGHELLFEDTSVGDYGNNMLDLIANTMGSVIGVLAASRFVGSPGRVTASGAS